MSKAEAKLAAQCDALSRGEWEEALGRWRSRLLFRWVNKRLRDQRVSNTGFLMRKKSFASWRPWDTWSLWVIFSLHSVSHDELDLICEGIALPAPGTPQNVIPEGYESYPVWNF